MNTIELAKEAGLVFGLQMYVDHYQLERFAVLVRAEALEEAAKVCEESASPRNDAYQASYILKNCAAAIRGMK